MSVETISYQASIEGLTFKQPVLIEAAPPPIRHIEMTVREPGVSIVFHFDADAGVELAQGRTCAQEMAERLLDALALQYKVSVGTTRYAGYTGCADDGSQVVGLHDELVVSDKVTCSVTVARPAADPFEQALRQPRDVNQLIFRLALNQPDLVTRFMLLYWILLSCIGDEQLKVDKQLLRLDPSIPSTPGPSRKAGKSPETVFTRLRNDLGHIRGPTPAKTLGEIEEQVGNLLEIVKKVLQNP